MKKYLFLSCAFLISSANAFTEADAIEIALKKNPDILASKIELRHDNLELKKVRSDRLVQANISGNNAVEFHPATGKKYSGSKTTSSSFETSLGGTVSRYFPGGGSVSASIKGDGFRDLDSSQTDFTTTTAVTASQPLLRDAWSNAPLDYQINIEQKNLNRSYESFKKSILDILTQVRGAYLDWLSADQTVAIRRAELAYALNALEYERARYLLGEKAEMDTLSAALELLRARENLMSDEYAEKTARNRFALVLGLEQKALPDLTDSTISINPIPSAETIIKDIKAHHYQLKLLDITREILELQQKKSENALLPRVDVSAGLSALRRGTGYFSGSGATAVHPNVMDPWVGISFSYDILARRKRYQKKQTELTLHSNEIEKRYLINKKKVEVGEFVDAWEQDAAKLAIRTAEVNIAAKNHDYALERYQLGEIDNLAKLKARSDLINARLNKLIAEVNLKRLEIAVDKATTNVLRRFRVELKSER